MSKKKVRSNAPGIYKELRTKELEEEDELNDDEIEK